jgi:uncharacterized membrane protein
MNGDLGLALRALHVLGVIAWVGGVVTCGLMVVVADDASRRGAAAAARKVARMMSTPGMLLAWLAGLAILIPNFSGYYAQAGWMHGKLTLVFVASGMTGALSGMLKRTAAGEEVKLPRLRVLAVGILVIAAIVVFLVEFQPGGAG